ncbi:disulfide bond formation protein DsbB/BdbC [Hyaloraphidium curvatum]|nr:disulfide bond formation protein DsbB/BdbC [Hyaloraphidium curvatum]
MQRYPYAMVAALGLPALLRLPPWLATLLLSFDALAMLSNAVIASYHVGVEQHWWTDELTCGAAADGLSLMEPTAIRCDEVPWELFGISMAGYNVPASLAMAGFAGAAAWYSRS